MIQRIQTLYLILALGSSAGLIFVFSLWLDENKTEVFAMDNYYYLGMFLGSAALSFISILSFKKRKNQFVFGRLNIILNFVLLGLLVSESLNLSGDASVSEKGIGMFIPIVSIVFLVLANVAIKKDENLVKSVDRLR